MVKWLKYILLGVIAIVFLPFAVLLGAGYITFRLIKYLLKEKGEYKNIKDCFMNIKNVGALIAIVLGIVLVPTGLVKYTMFCLEAPAKAEIAKEEQKEEREKVAEENKYNSDREKLLTPRKRMSGDPETIDDRCILTKEDIKKYNITDEEISKFEEEKKVAIQNYKDKKTIEKFEEMALEHVARNTTSTVGRNYFSEKKEGYGYNKDKTTVTIHGRYEARTLQLVNVRSRYTVKFDVKTEEILQADLGKELVNSQKHPKNK
ncbi:MAG: hypothetical protein ACRC28_02595 [Clostridium sp.]|uniref:hypothetical protein n=1 Tax=Clostridium sp. TaxID=1506 RepID=UPI003F358FDF